MNTKTKTIDAGRPAGMLHGTVKVSVPMKEMPLHIGQAHPAEVIGHYVQEQVAEIMDRFGSLPTEVTVRLHVED